MPGFTSVMIDASKESLTRNIEINLPCCLPRQQKFNASTEAELGPILGDEGVAGSVDARKIRFLYGSRGGCHFLQGKPGFMRWAIAVGTAHGLYKRYSSAATGN